MGAQNKQKFKFVKDPETLTEWAAKRTSKDGIVRGHTFVKEKYPTEKAGKLGIAPPPLVASSELSARRPRLLLLPASLLRRVLHCGAHMSFCSHRSHGRSTSARLRLERHDEGSGTRLRRKLNGTPFCCVVP